MLNIISRSILFKNVSGPKKVVENLIKGLDKISYPYVINKRLDACKRLWIHDDTKALREISNLPKEIKIIVGPNIYNLPKDIPEYLDLSTIVYLQPSIWTKSFWLKFGADKYSIEVWPTGIDTEEFKPSRKTREKKEFVLVYFKKRFADELETVKNALNRKNIDYRIIDYAKGYKESNYKNLLVKSKYVIWLGIGEAQGIALQEALSVDVPILVCDVYSVGHRVGGEEFSQEEKEFQNTTSAPYFDSRCGIKIKDLNDLRQGIDFMESHLKNFKPREYILENLSLDKKQKI